MVLLLNSGGNRVAKSMNTEILGGMKFGQGVIKVAQAIRYAGILLVLFCL